MSGHEYYRDLAAAEAEEGGELHKRPVEVPSPLEQAAQCVSELLELPIGVVRIHLKSLVRSRSRKSGAMAPLAKLLR